MKKYMSQPINVRIDPDLRDALVRVASRRGWSLTRTVEAAIERYALAEEMTVDDPDEK